MKFSDFMFFVLARGVSPAKNMAHQVVMTYDGACQLLSH
jgi:hypothetical protein